MSIFGVAPDCSEKPGVKKCIVSFFAKATPDPSGEALCKKIETNIFERGLETKSWNRLKLFYHLIIFNFNLISIVIIGF